jgi:hypothetical protein
MGYLNKKRIWLVSPENDGWYAGVFRFGLEKIGHTKMSVYT